MKIRLIKKPSSEQKPVRTEKLNVTMLVHVPRSMRRQLSEMKSWFRSNLHVNVSTSFLVREYVREGLANSKNQIRIAERGRLHAKTRNLKQIK